MKRYLSIILVTLISQFSYADELPIIEYKFIHHPVISKTGMVVSQRQLASEVGATILRNGGNAVDAAVATGLALAVVLPRAGNIGGGGFMVVYMKDLNKTIAIDYREKAPSAAHRDLFLDENGNYDKRKAQFSLLSAGVPGTVAGLHHALINYGSYGIRWRLWLGFIYRGLFKVCPNASQWWKAWRAKNYQQKVC